MINSKEKESPTYRITTLGCKVNQFEAEVLARQLEAAGYAAAKAGETADLCVVNTCTVTQKASMQSRQAARQAVRANPESKIVVTGCYAQIEPEILRAISGVDLVIGQTDKNEIPERIIGTLEKRTGENGSAPVPAVSAPPPIQKRSRPFLKIQDGCNAFCTYCIVPHARGRSRSMPEEWVLQQIRGLSEAGYKEVVLTGIHLGCYGADLTPETSLTALLTKLLDQNRLRRIRLSSVEPGEVSDEMIRMAADPGEGGSRLCRHFHIPMQSGDDEILKRMGRPYSARFFEDLVYKIKDAIPDAGIGADVLVGFPGETERSFEITRSLLERLPLTYLHVFPFSPRKGTPAYDYPDKIASDVIKKRAAVLRALGGEKKARFAKQHVGRQMQVLVEGKRDTWSGMLKGITANYLPVLLEGDDELMNRIVRVRIDRLDEAGRIFGDHMS